MTPQQYLKDFTYDDFTLLKTLINVTLHIFLIYCHKLTD
jgi:hypothetical protein